ncbi:ATP-binding protein [Pirellulaceae bacterium SH449]
MTLIVYESQCRYTHPNAHVLKVRTRVRLAMQQGMIEEQLVTSATTESKSASTLYDDIDLAELFLASPDAIVICDEGGRIVLANDQLCRMFDYSEQMLIGKSIEVLIPDRSRDCHIEHRIAYATDPQLRLMGNCREVVGLRKDGREICLEIRLRPFKSAQRSLIVAAIRDVTEIRFYSTICKKSRQLLEQIATGQPTSEVLMELVKSIEDWTPGVRCSVMRLDSNQQRFYTMLAPRLPRCISDTIDKLSDIKCGPRSLSVHSNERVITCEIDTAPEWTTLRELALQHHLGACWSEPIRDARGVVLGSFVVYHDKPHQPTEAELEFVATAAHLAGIAINRDLRTKEFLEKEEQLRQSQKLDAIGTLAGGIAHEFNNLLQVILGYTSCVIDDIPAEHPSFGDLETVRTAGEQARDLTRQILTFSRHQETSKSILEVRNLVHQVGKFLRPLLDARIELNIECSQENQPILADPSQLQQVLVNLCLNARDAIDGAGFISIRSQMAALDKRKAHVMGRVTGELAVCISVSDSGCGMSPEVCAKVFDPFFTTKPIGKGTGLGLSVVHGIISDHAGAIEIDSELKKGTSFHLYFPVADNPSKGEMTAPPPESPTLSTTSNTQESINILIAIDETSESHQLAKLLTAEGYCVMIARDSEDAIGKFRSHANKLELVVLGFNYPSCEGQTVARAIRRTHSEIPIIRLNHKNPIEIIPPTSETSISTDILERVREIVTKLGSMATPSPVPPFSSPSYPPLIESIRARSL